MIRDASENHREMAEMLRDYLTNPHQFYEDLFGAAKDAGVNRPGLELANLLGIAESSANRFARQRESDEAPTATGARSDLDRLLLTFKHFALAYSIPAAQTLVNALQQSIDDAIDHQAALMKNANVAHIKEVAMREAQDVAVAIGANKSGPEILRESAEAQVAAKLVVALQKIAS